MKVRLTRSQWEAIGMQADWIDAGFGAERFKFFSGPGVYCVCPWCGHTKGSVRMMPCERLTCPRCGRAKMEKKYIRGKEQMSPRQF
jgi:hypothetical protein